MLSLKIHTASTSISVHSVAPHRHSIAKSTKHHSHNRNPKTTIEHKLKLNIMFSSFRSTQIETAARAQLIHTKVLQTIQFDVDSPSCSPVTRAPTQRKSPYKKNSTTFKVPTTACKNTWIWVLQTMAHISWLWEWKSVFGPCPWWKRICDVKISNRPKTDYIGLADLS